MTATFPLPRETRETAILTGDGASTQFGPFAFKIFDTADVQVWVKTAAAAQFVKTAVTVAKTTADPLSHFTVTFAAAPAADTDFIVVSRRTHERSTDATRDGSIDSRELEKELSKQGSVLQELRRDLLRTVRTDFDRSAGVTLATIPAGNFYKTDADGNLVDGGDADDIINAQANAAIATQQAAQAGLQRGYAAEWANNPEDVPVSVAAGGDGVSTFSSRHWQAKTEALQGSKLIVQDHAELATKVAEDVAVGNIIWIKAVGGAVKRVTANEDLDYTGSGGLKYQVLPLGGLFNVEMFEAKGDFVNNDGPAFQQAIVAAMRERVQKILVPPNHPGAAYLIDGMTLHEPAGFSRLIWIGGGHAATTIFWRNMSFGQFAYNLDKDPADVSYGHGFRDITLRCENNTTATALRVRNASYLDLQNVQIFSFFDGIVFTGRTVDITGATQANPVEVTANAHGFSDGDTVIIDGVGGMTQINNRSFTVANATANTFELSGEDGTGHGAFTSGGFVSEQQSTFSNGGRNVIFNAIRRNSVRFERFRGGGHFHFDTWTLQSETAEGIYGDPWSDVGQITLTPPNFEQCALNDFRWDGTLRGLEMAGYRTEGLNGTAHILLYPAAGKFVSGVSVTGGFFTADAGAAVPLVIGGNGGDVRGFQFSGNHVSYGGVGSYFVQLNGAGASGVIEANHCDQVMAGAVNTPRTGVRVQSNSDANGPLKEYTGTEAVWTPVDASGAGLTLSGAVLNYRTVGDDVILHGYVTYPSTADGSVAELTLPLPVSGAPTTPVAGLVTYAGTAAQALFGWPAADRFQILNQATGAGLANSALSGRKIYISGQYKRA